jgi:Na+-driven multidrug efflux pump
LRRVQTVILALLIRGRSGLRLTRENLRPAWDRIRRLLRISLPAAGDSLTNVVCQLWFLRLINRLGAVATAAHGVAIRCEAIAFLTITAFGVAASTLCGQYLGPGGPTSRAVRQAPPGCWERHFFRSWVWSCSLRGDRCSSSSWRAVRTRCSSRALRCSGSVALAMPALATINVLNGTLNGAGDTCWPWMITMSGYLLVRHPLDLRPDHPQAQGGWGLGLKGAWLAMFADLYVRAVLVAGRFLQRGWLGTRV